MVKKMLLFGILVLGTGCGEDKPDRREVRDIERLLYFNSYTAPEFFYKEEDELKVGRYYTKGDIRPLFIQDVPENKSMWVEVFYKGSDIFPYKVIYHIHSVKDINSSSGRIGKQTISNHVIE